MGWQCTVISKKGVNYVQSSYDGSWWRRNRNWDKPNILIGAERNLPKEIQKKLITNKKIS